MTLSCMHKERVISVKKPQNLHLEFYKRNVPCEMRTPWKVFDVMRFQVEIKVAQQTAATPHVDPDDDSQQSPDLLMPDLEQTAAQSPGYILQISSRRA